MVFPGRLRLFLVFTIFLIVSLASCQVGNVTKIPTEEKPIVLSQMEPSLTATQNKLTWVVELIKWETASDLKGSQSAQQYNGDVTQIQFSEKPSDGKIFLLIEMSIDKQIPGPSTFDWDQLYIVDPAGNQYHRMANDTFLQNFNFPRIKSTNLSIGENKGFICFEIPIEASVQKLELVISNADGTQNIPLK
jgi:hypothetical protein